VADPISILQRMKHAGVAGSARAIWSRGSKKLCSVAPVRAWLDNTIESDVSSLAERINWGDCAKGDFKSRFLTKPGSRHYFDRAQAAAKRVQNLFPEAASKTIQIADDVCEHKFDLLGRDVTFTNGIDWFWLPETSARWPVLHTALYPKAFYNAADRPGDIKYPWELNRHQYFVTLGKAFALTGDEKYARTFRDICTHWIETNPLNRGINWYSALELGIRVISWADAIRLFKNSIVMDNDFVRFVVETIYRHGKLLHRNLSTDWLVANNHLIGEAAGLFGIAIQFTQFPESDLWRERSEKLMYTALLDQTFSDGVNKEQSTGYLLFILDFALHSIVLAGLNESAVPDEVMKRLLAMLRYASAITSPDGTAPPIGDYDDGRGVLLTESTGGIDFRGWLGVAANLWDRTEYGEAGCEDTEDSVWMLGQEASKRSAADISTHGAIAFPEGGVAILRTHEGPLSTWAYVRAGDFGLGMDGGCAHSHADLLAPVIYWRGKPFAIDCGTFAYLDKSEKRDWYRSGFAHNTMLPEGHDQGEIIPRWNWARVPKGEMLRCECDSSGAAVFVGRYDTGEFWHQRTIGLQNNPLVITIEDELKIRNPFKVKPLFLKFHLAPGATVAEVERGYLRIAVGDDHTIDCVFTPFERWECTESNHSPSYGVEIPHTCLTLVTHGQHVKTSIQFSDGK
jgi:hypothetical protein